MVALHGELNGYIDRPLQQMRKVDVNELREKFLNSAQDAQNFVVKNYKSHYLKK